MHVPEFVADTLHLSAEELGAYWALMMHGWESLGIPNDLRRIATIARLPRRRIKEVWATLAPFWKPEHPSCDACLISPRQEEVRESERLRIELERLIIKRQSAEDEVARLAAADQQAADEEAARRAADAERQRRYRKSQKVTSGKRDKTADVTPVNRDKRVTKRDKAVTVTPEASPSPPTPPVLPLETSPPSSSLRSDSSGDASAAPADASPDTWQERLRAAARALSDRTIDSFTPDDRMIAGQYHCLTFANCTKSETKNKAQATKVAAAFASMGRNKTYGQITFNEYVFYARQVHEKREEMRWFDPWLIRSVVEYDQEQAS